MLEMTLPEYNIIMWEPTKQEEKNETDIRKIQVLLVNYYYFIL